MIEIFSIRVFGLHWVTVTSLLLVFLISYYKIRGPFILRLVLASILAELAFFFYDLIWIYTMWKGFGTVSIFDGVDYPRFYVVISLLCMLMIFSWLSKSVHLQLTKQTILLFTCFVVSMYYMLYIGWFTDFMYYANKTSTYDPHNWLWAVSKTTGHLLWSGVVKNKTDIIIPIEKVGEKI